MLEVRNLTKRFRAPTGEVTALDDVSLTVPSGEFLAIQGASGSGKTTLLLAIGGLERPDRGSIALDAEDPYARDAGARAAFRASFIGFVFQQYHLVPYLSALENVLSPSLAKPDGAAADRARELIRQFGLEDRAGHLPSALSAGERQRVAIARALFNRPRLLLADEPTGNLDRDNAEIVLRHLAEFARAGGTVVLVTHDEKTAAPAQRIVHMSRGRLTTG